MASRSASADSTRACHASARPISIEPARKTEGRPSRTTGVGGLKPVSMASGVRRLFFCGGGSRSLPRLHHARHAAGVGDRLADFPACLFQTTARLRFLPHADLEQQPAVFGET